MNKFLKVYFKINVFISLLLITYSLIIFIASLLNISILIDYVNVFINFSTFDSLQYVSPTYLLCIGLLGYFINQYFYRISKTLYHFDKFREITGIGIIPIFSIFQLGVNFFILGFFACIPFLLNITGTVCLHVYQNNNRKKLISEYSQEFAFQDPTMHKMSLKIGQLRILKSEGKISEEEFLFHLNNILENKE